MDEDIPTTLTRPMCFVYLFWHIKQKQVDTAVHGTIIAFWHNTDWNIHPFSQCKIDHWWGKEAAFLKSGIILLFPVRVTFVLQCLV